MDFQTPAAADAATADDSNAPQVSTPSGALPLELALGELKTTIAMSDKRNDSDTLREAHLLLALKQRVERGEAGDITWEKYCARDIPERSWRHVQRLTAIAASPNPAETLEKARARNAAAMRRRREQDKQKTKKGKNEKGDVTRVTPPPLKPAEKYQAAWDAVLKLELALRMQLHRKLGDLIARAQPLPPPQPEPATAADADDIPAFLDRRSKAA